MVAAAQESLLVTARRAPRAASPCCVDCGARWSHAIIPCGPLSEPRCWRCQDARHQARLGAAPASRPAPALPLPVFEDGTSNEQIVPPGPESCVRALEAHDAPAPEQDLEAALRASVETPKPRPAWMNTPASLHAQKRDLFAPAPAAVSCARWTELDPHERAKYAPPGQPRSPGVSMVRRGLARGAA